MAALETSQIVVIVAGCLVIVGALIFIVYAHVASQGKVSKLVDEVGGALGFTRAEAFTSIWAENVGFGAPPLAQGRHDGIPAELRYLPRGSAVLEKDQTRIALRWSRPICRAGFDRYEEVTDPSVAKLPAFLNQPLVPPEANLRWKKNDWPGPATFSGSDADLARVFDAMTRKQLSALSRQLTRVLFHDDIMVIEWLGLESNPSIVRQAFDAAIACMEHLAPK